MYRKPSPQLTIDDFILPFSGRLSAENRLVQLAKIIPWDEIEKDGQPAAEQVVLSRRQEKLLTVIQK